MIHTASYVWVLSKIPCVFIQTKKKLPFVADMSFENNNKNAAANTGPKRKYNPNSKDEKEPVVATATIADDATVVLESDTSDDAYSVIVESLLEVFDEMYDEMIRVYRSLFDAQKKIAAIRAMHLHHSELTNAEIEQRAKERKAFFNQYREQEGIALVNLMDLQTRVIKNLNSIRKEHPTVLQRMIAGGTSGHYEELVAFSNDPIPDPSPVAPEKQTASSAGQPAIALRTK